MCIWLPFDITVEPRLIDTSQSGRGGALSGARVIRALRNTLRESGRTYVTTFFDLYGLRPDFPGVEASQTRNGPLQKCRTIEAALAEAAIEASGCRTDLHGGRIAVSIGLTRVDADS